MFDNTDNACVLAGMAAIGAIVWSRNQNRMYYGPHYGQQTPCSAMKSSIEEVEEADGVFAMAAGVEGEETDDVFQSLFPSVSKDFEKQYEDAKVSPGGDFYSEKVQKTIADLKPKYQLETNHSATLGNCIPIPGRSFDHCKPKKFKVTGGMLYQTEAYAEQLESQKEVTD